MAVASDVITMFEVSLLQSIASGQVVLRETLDLGLPEWMMVPLSVPPFLLGTSS
jgi:hypothetical protein